MAERAARTRFFCALEQALDSGNINRFIFKALTTLPSDL